MPNEETIKHIIKMRNAHVQRMNELKEKIKTETSHNKKRELVKQLKEAEHALAEFDVSTDFVGLRKGK